MVTQNKLMAFDPKRYDPDSCNKARDLLAEFKRPNGEIVLNLQRSSRLEQAIADTIHDAKQQPPLPEPKRGPHYVTDGSVWPDVGGTK